MINLHYQTLDDINRKREMLAPLEEEIDFIRFKCSDFDEEEGCTTVQWMFFGHKFEIHHYKSIPHPDHEAYGYNRSSEGANEPSIHDDHWVYGEAPLYILNVPLGETNTNLINEIRQRKFSSSVTLAKAMMLLFMSIVKSDLRGFEAIKEDAKSDGSPQGLLRNS